MNRHRVLHDDQQGAQHKKENRRSALQDDQRGVQHQKENRHYNLREDPIIALLVNHQNENQLHRLLISHVMD